MSLKSYELLRNFLHAVGNTTKDNSKNKNDKLFNIKPLLQLVRQNCLKIEPEELHCIDEQTIQAKTKRSSGLRQYNPKKIHKYCAGWEIRYHM